MNRDELNKILLKGKHLLSSSKYQEALEAFNKAIELDPKSAPVWILKGLILTDLKKYGDACEIWKTVLEIDQKSELAWMGNGYCLLKVNRYEEAKSAFDKAIELTPENATAWPGKAETLYHTNSTNDALEAIEKALSYSQDNGSFFNTKGVIMMRLGQYSEATNIFEEAFRIDSESLYMANKASALISLSRYNEAKEALQRAMVTTQDKEADAKKYQKYIDRLTRREHPVMWTTWWFGDGGIAGWVKRLFGGIVILLLIFYLILPLVNLNIELLLEEKQYWWINLGRDWQSYVVPVVSLIILLLSPMIRSIGPQGIKLSPNFTSPELTLRDIPERIAPEFD